jgi:2-oxoisovalerate dehydrogenase E2 component (dihydrolipoyl transacylase)
MTLREFVLPDPGEGLTEAEIVTWHVAPGDVVKVNDVVVEIETAKSLVELPVPFAGVVGALLVAEGDTVAVGTPIITVDEAPAGSGGASPTEQQGGSAGPDAAAAASDAVAAASDAVPARSQTPSAGRTAVLVGYGVKQTEATRRPRSRPVAAGRHGEPGGEPITGERVRALAKPPVRKLARDLGVDLGLLTPSGPGGVVTRADVEAAAAAAGSDAIAATAAAASLASAAGTTTPGAPAREERVPVRGVRKVTAQAMVASAFTAPHVTEWVTVDVSRTMELVATLKRDIEFRDVKVTPLLVLAKAMCVAVRRNPGINASWDEPAQEIVLKRYVNLGIAAATPRGLVVPNVKDADRMTMRELGEAIATLTDTAREGRTQPADLAGGTITITNVGVFGIEAGTPILNPGESAILAFGAVSRRPWVVTDDDGTESVVPRWVTTLALSFDHRLVDGELGSRYLADVAALLENPARGLVWA